MDSVFVPLLVGCVVALASALGVVIARKPVYSAIFLLVHSLSLAALYGLLSAAIVAVGQIVIYSGAIVVLFLFVVTLLPSGGRELGDSGGRLTMAIVAAGGVLIAVAAAVSAGINAIPAEAAGDLGVAAVGHVLFSGVLVAFELTAPLLLVAIIGAVVIWRRHEPRPRTAQPTKAREPRSLVMHR